MGEQRASGASSSTDSYSTPSPSASPSPSPAPRQHVTLLEPSHQHKKKSKKVFRVFRSVFRSFPIITPAACKIPVLPGGSLPDQHRSGSSGSRVTGTLFGYRKGRVSLSIQESPRCLPSLVVELAMQTMVLQKELSGGMVRIALETEKRGDKEKIKIMDEPLWTMFSNGKKTGYGVKRDATEEDLNVMELLRPVSMGAGVLPGNTEFEGPDSEMAYMRAYFERVVGIMHPIYQSKSLRSATKVLVEMAEHLTELEKMTKPVLDALRSYQDLPPDKALATLEFEDKKRQYEAAEKRLEEVLQSALE
ncbi:unnamed protein product [Arabidopsis thaliana]|uniref:(thale cress) hypothetical protein n=1 Tax=Arabidopsis thaliana TaxID=3702 RepID=A0A7G2EBH3_ARATH|nr:unnamed protein product [Arabidopsis thaliana]